MYEAHFGLSLRPFGPSAKLVELPSRDAASRRVRYGLEQGDGMALLFGPPGVGKTTLARAISADLDLPTVHLTFPAMPAAELLAFLADELQAPGIDSTLGGSVRRIRSALAETAARGARTLVVVDEAHLIADPETFETLRLLTNFASNGLPDPMLLLVGGAEILLRLPHSLLDRLATRALLGPLSESETASYLNGRLALAGGRSALFDDEAIAILHRASDGLPRRLNRMADLALLIAYAEGLPRPDARAIAIATRDATHDAIAA